MPSNMATGSISQGPEITMSVTPVTPTEISILGDFNVHYQLWLSSPFTDHPGEIAFNFAILHDLEQLVQHRWAPPITISFLYLVLFLQSLLRIPQSGGGSQLGRQVHKDIYVHSSAMATTDISCKCCDLITGKSSLMLSPWRTVNLTTIETMMSHSQDL
ncbi:hypothetical protein E2C01_030610 [Portunus trituberculatus]|uniref:Endonuclease/exonuclease/phosphatase domain-containing protein n=1 Tax=Portunus trituberculatus TaxID=210409 RepID=A0A5B7EVB1_PORTR|nr:hypothetical protein [Portunus trituberculatus]